MAGAPQRRPLQLNFPLASAVLAEQPEPEDERRVKRVLETLNAIALGSRFSRNPLERSSCLKFQSFTFLSSDPTASQPPAPLIATASEFIGDVDLTLTLDGLRLVYERTRGREPSRL